MWHVGCILKKYNVYAFKIFQPTQTKLSFGWNFSYLPPTEKKQDFPTEKSYPSKHKHHWGMRNNCLLIRNNSGDLRISLAHEFFIDLSFNLLTLRHTTGKKYYPCELKAVPY